MQAIQKCATSRQLLQADSWFNALMAWFRVVLENLFAEVDQVFASLQCTQQKKLGRQDVSKMFPSCMVLHNVHADVWQSNVLLPWDGLVAQHLAARLSPCSSCLSLSY